MRTRELAHLCKCVHVYVCHCVCVFVRGRMCADYVKPNAVLKHDSLRACVTSPRRVPTILTLFPNPSLPSYPFLVLLIHVDRHRSICIFNFFPFTSYILVRYTTGRKTRCRQMITHIYSSDLSHRSCISPASQQRVLSISNFS